MFQSSTIEFETKFLPPNLANKLFSRFMDLPYDDAHSSRQVKWFGPIDYKYGGISLSPSPIQTIEEIDALRIRLEQHIGASFNSCLVNLYKDEKSMVPKHSDDEDLFGLDPIIASVSLGCSRRFLLESKLKNSPCKHCFLLQAGDLLIMKGETQRKWLHSVPPERFKCTPRINLTFRNVVYFDHHE